MIDKVKPLPNNQTTLSEEVKSHREGEARIDLLDAKKGL